MCVCVCVCVCSKQRISSLLSTISCVLTHNSFVKIQLSTKYKNHTFNTDKWSETTFYICVHFILYDPIEVRYLYIVCVYICVCVIRNLFGKKTNTVVFFNGQFHSQQVQRNVNKHTLIKDVLAFLNYTNQPPLVILTAESREKSEKYEL